MSKKDYYLVWTWGDFCVQDKWDNPKPVLVAIADSHDVAMRLVVAGGLRKNQDAEGQHVRFWTTHGVPLVVTDKEADALAAQIVAQDRGGDA